MMVIYFRLFRDAVGEREPEPSGDVTLTKEELKDMGKEHIYRKKGPKRGEINMVRCAAGFTEVQNENTKLLGAIFTGIRRDLPYAQFGERT